MLHLAQLLFVEGNVISEMIWFIAFRAAGFFLRSLNF